MVLVEWDGALFGPFWQVDTGFVLADLDCGVSGGDHDLGIWDFLEFLDQIDGKYGAGCAGNSNKYAIHGGLEWSEIQF